MSLPIENCTPRLYTIDNKRFVIGSMPFMIPFDGPGEAAPEEFTPIAPEPTAVALELIPMAPEPITPEPIRTPEPIAPEPIAPEPIALEPIAPEEPTPFTPLRPPPHHKRCGSAFRGPSFGDNSPMEPVLDENTMHALQLIQQIVAVTGDLKAVVDNRNSIVMDLVQEVLCILHPCQCLFSVYRQSRSTHPPSDQGKAKSK
ncbi:uncharacterized protein BXZ73DRAFT_75879 [Epithele typhae]|uniref:uncharacterized protein n=1 Tax=Epithele typhae TaxID=378194 RepID=UPI0020077AC2|nr:uncharacterized protein BXZ73DRAFT_75879 [Epithele typhae]KAH9939691.1 hypothetical protein BXZ73DRAFT_75879 [Epithele typhae]